MNKNTTTDAVILITFHDGVTTADIYHKGEVATATARCMDSDVFDIKTGAMLALSRLEGSNTNAYHEMDVVEMPKDAVEAEHMALNFQTLARKMSEGFIVSSDVGDPYIQIHWEQFRERFSEYTVKNGHAYAVDGNGYHYTAVIC